jgi:hypothetical protein
MKVKLSQAIKMFFGNSSLEMVYFEAIANALDADATEVKIMISAQSFSKVETINISIEDNGVGFTDERYRKFCRLFDVDENSHKGLGRLVFPFYFESINISSYYDGVYHRKFDFTEDIDEKSSVVTSVPKRKSGTTIILKDYTLSKLKQHSFIQARYLKERILEEFYPRLFQLKQQGRIIIIELVSEVEGKKESQTISTNEIPQFSHIELESTISTVDRFYLHYYIEEIPHQVSTLITAISVDNRTKKIEIIAEENLPVGYKMVFLLYSDWFIGKVDLARQNLTISEHEKQQVQKIFRDKVASIISERLPKVAARNKSIQERIVNKFPHLTGYFNTDEFGYLSENDVIKNAQDKFFKAQRRILGASSSLSDDEFRESLELSSRALTEYILFRQITIERLRKIKKSDGESVIHNLIVPKYKMLKKNELTDDLYLNNAWILDDKYMTYDTILSDRQMSELIDIITEGEHSEPDSGKPDITFIFSRNPDQNSAVDLVIVELKKKGLTLESTMVVETQLLSRARRLLKHFENKIQRIWFYGIIEFSSEIELHLKSDYKELFSLGKTYFRQSSVVVQPNPEIRVPVGIFMMDLESVVEDAHARNSTFLNLIKSKFQK